MAWELFTLPLEHSDSTSIKANIRSGRRALLLWCTCILVADLEPRTWTPEACRVGPHGVLTACHIDNPSFSGETPLRTMILATELRLWRNQLRRDRIHRNLT